MNTQRLSKDTTFLLLNRGAFGTKQDPLMSGYLRLPLSTLDAKITGPVWRVTLELTGQNRGLLPFEIAGDVVFGRGSDGPDAPDLDMSALGAHTLGVSRRHALLRPTARQLFLIDLDSTNGTFINSLQVKGRAQSLNKGDHISLGKLNMDVILLEILPPEEVNKPAELETQSVPPENASTSDLPW